VIPAQDEGDEAQGVNPVSDAHQSGMPRRIQNFLSFGLLPLGGTQILPLPVRGNLA